MTIIDESAEWSLLSSLLNPALQRFMPTLKPAIFTDNRVKIFNVMLEAYLAGEIVDDDTIKAGLGYYPSELDLNEKINVEATINHLANLAKRRQLSDKADELKLLSAKTKPDDVDLISIIEWTPVESADDGTIYSGATSYFSTLRQKRTGHYVYNSSGLPFVDNACGGEWKPGNLFIILGNGGSGKTSFALNSMYRMGLDNRASLLISLEMAKDELFARLLSMHTGMNYKKVSSGIGLNGEDFDRIDAAGAAIQEMPLYIIDNDRGMPFSKIMYNIREYCAVYDVRTVFIDYLQIVDYDTGNRVSDLGYISRQLRLLAKKLNIAIVLLSQVTEENREQERVRDSRQAAHPADFIGELVMEPATLTDPGRSGEFKRYKNRLGPVGATPIVFYGATQIFEGQ